MGTHVASVAARCASNVVREDKYKDKGFGGAWLRYRPVDRVRSRLCTKAEAWRSGAPVGGEEGKDPRMPAHEGRL